MGLGGDLGLGHVELIEELGSGGSGKVFKAYDKRLNRHVAIKVMDAVVDDAEREQFESECQLHGPLSDHDNIVTVYRAGYTDASNPYLEMELIVGGSLEAKLAESGRMPWRQAIELVLPICGAVEAAHVRGVLHRDLKPANILLAPKGPKLADFGIACLHDESNPIHSLSWQHAPPEAIDNERDVRSDVYSLASTLYQLVAGHTPFGKATVTNAEGIIGLIREAPVPMLPTDLAPPWLNQVLLSALSKRPDDRPATMAEFRTVLETGLKDTTSEAGDEQPSVVTTKLADEPGSTAPQERPSTTGPTRYLSKPPPKPAPRPAGLQPVGAGVVAATGPSIGSTGSALIDRDHARSVGPSPSGSVPSPTDASFLPAPTPAAVANPPRDPAGAESVVERSAGISMATFGRRRRVLVVVVAILLAVALIGMALVLIGRSPATDESRLPVTSVDFPAVVLSDNVELTRSWALNETGSLLLAEVVITNRGADSFTTVHDEVLPSSVTSDVNTVRAEPEPDELLGAASALRYLIDLEPDSWIRLTYDVEVSADGASPERLAALVEDQREADRTFILRPSGSDAAGRAAAGSGSQPATASDGEIGADDRPDSEAGSGTTTGSESGSSSTDTTDTTDTTEAVEDGAGTTVDGATSSTGSGPSTSSPDTTTAQTPTSAPTTSGTDTSSTSGTSGTTGPPTVRITGANATATVTTGRISFQTNVCSTALYELDSGESHSAPGWPDATSRCWTSHGHTFTGLEPATTYVASVTVRDEEGNTAQVRSITFTTGSADDAISIVSPSSPEVIVGETNTWQMVAQGGSGQFTWTGISLPAGFSLSSSGLLTIRPTTTATQTLTVRATDVVSQDSADLTFVLRPTAP